MKHRAEGCGSSGQGVDHGESELDIVMELAGMVLGVGWVFPMKLDNTESSTIGYVV